MNLQFLFVLVVSFWVGHFANKWYDAKQDLEDLPSVVYLAVFVATAFLVIGMIAKVFQ